jgi:hypothetical protein
LAYIGIPKDLNKIKSKFALGMTASQIGHILIGAARGVPLFFLARGSLGNGPAMLMLFASVAPFAFLALYEKDGMPARKWIYLMLRHKIFPQRRVYKTQNFYSKINHLAKEGEIDTKQKANTGRPKRAAGKKRKGG